jgi:oligoendopeptidase F
MASVDARNIQGAAIPVEETWNLEAMFRDVASWQQEFESVQAEISPLADFAGKLLESADTLLQFLRRSDALDERCARLHSYAYLRYYGDTSDVEAKKLLEQSSTLSAELAEAGAFFEPEVLRAEPAHLQELLSTSPELEIFRHRFAEIERWRLYTRSPEVESALAQLQPLHSIAEDIRTKIHDHEMQFSNVDVGGGSRALGHGNLDQFLTDPNRDVRERAYKAYTGEYLSRLPSLGETLSKQVVTSHVFSAVRNFNSTFDAAMFQEGYTPEVFWSVVNTCAEHRPLMQRYFRARATVLGLEKIAEYDLMAPLSAHPPKVPYSQAKEVILKSLEPLGGDYVRVAREGLTAKRWVDVHPRQGKYSNAFSAGSYLTQPYILMNYSPSISEVGTLTHELGHSMHSHLTNTSQPSCYSGYSMSIAETASNLNQVLLRAHLFKQGDRELEVAALEEAFYFIHRYLFLMPNLALLEHRLHSAYAEGEPMGYQDICKNTTDIFSEAYGDTLEFDRERLGSKWAQFCHLYMPFYTYQYAIGISAAMAIGERILQGDDKVVGAYLSFLRAGASKPPLEIFKLVDLDFTSKTPLLNAFKVVEGYVERLEKLAVPL